jgi:hypothetical protein
MGGPALEALGIGGVLEEAMDGLGLQARHIRTLNYLVESSIPIYPERRIPYSPQLVGGPALEALGISRVLEEAMDGLSLQPRGIR